MNVYVGLYEILFVPLLGSEETWGARHVCRSPQLGQFIVDYPVSTPWHGRRHDGFLPTFPKIYSASGAAFPYTAATFALLSNLISLQLALRFRRLHVSKKQLVIVYFRIQ